MNCIKCKRKANVKTEDKTFCDDCFCEVIEKRVRKEIRRQEIFSVRKNKDDICILILDNNTVKSALNKYLLKDIVKNSRVSFKIKNIAEYDTSVDYDSKKEFDKVVIPWNIDDETAGYMRSLLENTQTVKKNNTRIITPLISVTEDEAITFSRIKNLKFSKDSMHDDIRTMIDSLDKKYPGTKFSILKSIRKLF